MATRHRQARQGVGVFGGVENRMGRRNAAPLTFDLSTSPAEQNAWGRAIGSGSQLAAVDPDDVVALRTLSRWRTKPPVAAPAQRKASPASPARAPAVGPKSFGQEAWDQTLAGARGAQDAFTFGMGDRAYAGLRALGDAFSGANLGTAYARRMADEEARDRYDDAHYGTARTIGQVAGTAVQIAALDPAEGLLASGARIAKTTPLIAREIAALGGVGAGTGVTGQVITALLAERPARLETTSAQVREGRLAHSYCEAAEPAMPEPSQAARRQSRKICSTVGCH